MNFATLSRIAALVLAGAVAGDDALAQEPTRMTMDEAIRRALDQNPTFLVARDEIRRAQALVEEARAQSLPTLYGAGTYLRLDHDRTFSGVVTQPKSQVNLAATLAVPLVNPRAWAQWSHAGDNVDVAQANALDTRRTLGVATGHAYLEVFAQKRLLEANIRARDTAKAHFDFARLALRGGRRQPARRGPRGAAVVDRRDLRPVVVAAVERAEEALSVLLGLDAPVDAPRSPPAEPPPLIDAIDERDEDARRRRRRRAPPGGGRPRHARRWTDYSPYVRPSSRPSTRTRRPRRRRPAGEADRADDSVLRRRPPLRTGEGAQRPRRQARPTARGDAATGEVDVRAAFETLRRADSRSRRRATRRPRREALKLANLAYSAGATTNLEVIDAEQTARDAEIQAEVASDSARQARLDMLAAVGRFP